MDENKIKLCSRGGRKCSKPSGHTGGCDKKRKCTPFWEASPIQAKQKLSTQINVLNVSNTEAISELNSTLCEIEDARRASNQLNSENARIQECNSALENKLEEINNEYEKVKLLIDPKKNSQTLREQNPTTHNMIGDSSSSTRYKRLSETKNLLSYIHGGLNGAVFGAMDFLRKYSSTEALENFLIDLKKGKFLEKLNGKFGNIYRKSDAAMNQGIASKYKLFLSRRKFTFLCKVQAQPFDPVEQQWNQKSISYGDKIINMHTQPISNGMVEKFIKTLDIGDLHQIPGYCGLFRTITALTIMIIDLHLRTPSLRKKLIWFNSLENHFIMEFSDDGAPETREETMCIGSLSSWNFGKRICSRDFHYPLHTVSAKEKDNAVAQLWKQHAEEMAILEGNVLNIHNEKVTVEYHPSADQAWQFYANSELTQAATYPSMYANVHKSELKFIGGSIGFTPENKWRPPTSESRMNDLAKLNEYRKVLNEKEISQDTYHKKELAFMAEHGLRQFGEPLIGAYANLQRLEPLHLEVNSWQHLLYILYMEAMKHDKMEEFIKVLGDPVRDGGCSLKFIAVSVKEHYRDPNSRCKCVTMQINWCTSHIAFKTFP